jgi:hypothetical protein
LPRIDLPVYVDFEGEHSEDDGEPAANISHLIELGVIGTNSKTGSAGTVPDEN